MNTQFKISIIFLRLAGISSLLFLLTVTYPAQKAMHSGLIYKLRVTDSTSQTISVLQRGKELQIKLDGFGKPMSVIANGGGTETCRTTISHEDSGAKLVLSLPIPVPNMPCQMTPGTVTFDGTRFGVAEGEKEVAKLSGNDVQLRKAVERLFGKITRSAPAGED
jgi:hypothetical protein